MATMAENVIAAGSETYPPMLEKGMYDSWKTRIILYIHDKENGEVLKDSIDNSPYKFNPEIIVKDTDGVTKICRPQRLEDLAREERESIHSYYLRFTELIDDMGMIPMTMSPMQINMKFVNYLHLNGVDHVDAYDLDCNDEATANAIFTENLSSVGSLNDDTIEPRYDSDIHSEVPHYDTYHDFDMLNSNIQELGYIENIVSNNESYDDLKGNSDVISYTDYMLTIGKDEDNYVPPPVQKNDTMLSVIKQMKSQVEKCNKENQKSKSVNESLTIELEQYKERVIILEYAINDGHSEQEEYLSHKLYSAINDRNRKVKDFEKQVFLQQTQMKDLNNHIAFLKKNFETLKQESSERYEKNISEIVYLEKAKKELENIVFNAGQSAQTMHMLTKP
ncbi:hypothetical protein Tco_0708661 [Tanacetum coccineum]